MNSHLAYISISILCVWLQFNKSYAQECMVNGIVVDHGTQLGISNVKIEYRLSDIDKTVQTSSDGKFSILIPYNRNTTLRLSHDGYRPTTKLVIANKKAQKIRIELVSDTTLLSEVVIKRKIPIVTQRGDTTIYKASNYKVNSDATAYDLISQKLPGIGMKDGKLEAHGEQVKEIHVDGREFFKDDVNLALKNLPANIINEIQVYDQLSDYSKLTGFNDGNTKKTINITTKKGISSSQFGKATAGYGIDDVYKLYGMYNLFSNDSRWSLFTQMNNINEQNFSMIDLLSSTGTASSSAPNQSPYSKGATDNTFHPTSSDDISSMLVDVSDYGVTKSKAAGTNYSDEWADGRMKFSGHYLFNKSNNYTDYNIYDNYFGETASNNLQDQKVHNDNLNHRFNAKYEFDITEKNYLMIRPSFSYQNKNELMNLTDWTVTNMDTTLLLHQKTNTDQYVANTSMEAMYMHRFGDRGNTLTADARMSYIHTHEDINMDFSNVQTEDDALQKTMCKNTQKTFSCMLSYVLPISLSTKLKIDSGWKKTYGLMRRRTDIMANDAETYETDSLLSGSTWSDFGGMLFNLSSMVSTDRMNLVAGTELQLFKQYNSNDRLYVERNTYTLLPYAIMRYKLSRGILILQYKADHKYPGLAQVHDAINNSNAVMAIRGSIKLKPAYQHNIQARLVMPLLKNGAVFVFFTNLKQSDNYIGSLRSLASESFQEEGERRNTEIVSYQNSDGYISWTSLIAYGFPWKAISSNVNISSNWKYSKIPGYWDNIKQFTSQWSWSGSLTVGSNISEDVDFVLDVNSKFNSSKNLSFNDMNIRYWSLSYGGQLNWKFHHRLKTILECGRTNYFGSGTSRFNATISNVAIAYKCMKGQKGELRFSINDILNQNNSFYQTTTELYRREVMTNILGRYAMISFTYNLNTVKQKMNSPK